MNCLKISLFAVALLASLNGRSATPEYEKYLNQQIPDSCINYSPDELQSIFGKFDGIHTDTLTLFPLSGEKVSDGFLFEKWIVVSRNGTVPSKEIESYFPTIVYEGDLDGNGTDEFGVRLTGYSSFYTYKVYTTYKGGVSDFIDVDWWDGDLRDLQTAVSPAGRKGKVKICYYKMSIDNRGPFFKEKKITKFLK